MKASLSPNQACLQISDHLHCLIRAASIAIPHQIVRGSALCMIENRIWDSRDSTKDSSRAESCSRLLQSKDEIISEAEAHHVVRLLQAQLQANNKSQYGLVQEETDEQVALKGLKLAEELCDLACIAPNRVCLRLAGAISPLVNLLKYTPDKGESAAWATCLWTNCLRNLVVDTQASSRIAVEAGAISPLLSLCFSKSRGVQLFAAEALAMLSAGLNMDSSAISEINGQPMRAGVIDALLHLLRSKSELVAEGGAHLAAVLALDAKHNEMLGAAGVISLVVPLLEADSKQTQLYASTAILNLATCQANRSGIVDAQAMRALMPLLKSKCCKTQENATGTIMHLCTDMSLHEHVIQAGGVTRLLYPLQKGSMPVQMRAAAAFLNLSRNSASRISVAAAASFLVEISIKYQGEDLQLFASTAVYNLLGSESRDNAKEQEPGNLTTPNNDRLQYSLPSAFEILERRCKAARLWMYSQAKNCANLLRSSKKMEKLAELQDRERGVEKSAKDKAGGVVNINAISAKAF